MRTLILGLAVGAAIGYLLATDEDKEQLMQGAKKAAGKVKDYVNEGLQKGKKVMGEMRDRANEMQEG